MKLKVHRLLLVGILFLTQAGHAAPGIAVLNMSLDQSVESPRWMFENKVKIKGGPLIDLMVAAKRGWMAKDRSKCLSALQKAYALGKSLGPWLVWNQLICAQIKDVKGVSSLDALNSALNRVEAQPRWLVNGPWSASIKTAYVGALLALADQQVKTDRRSAWRTIDRLQQVRNWLNAEERASVYRWAGELSFIEQNLLAAQTLLQRSLNEKESADVRDKIESIRNSLVPTKPIATASAKVPKTVSPDDLGISDSEREIFSRMNRSYDSQDYVSAIEDGIELIQKFPGSRRASEAADRVLDIYLSVASKSEEKFRHVRESVVHEMVKVDATRMFRWANNAYARGYYQDALNLAEKAYEKFAGQPESTKALLLAGRAALASGEYDDAAAHLEEVLKKHGGTSEAVEANFRLGLLQFRGKRYSQAAAYFERLLALGNSKDFEYRALYWQWRAQQKLDREKSATYAEPLIRKYPLSYYGLRALAETSGAPLELKDTSTTAIKAEVRLLDSERLGWERLMILLKAGWNKEAEKEIELLPEPQTTEERVLRAKLWASALRYDLAIQNMNRALDENSALQQPSILKIVFPQEYSSYIAREAKAVNLNEIWIRSLIRQESTFKPDAKSSSNALGVMQLLPATAEEVAHDLKIKEPPTNEALLDPDLNIKLGTTYLARMVRNFNGNLPMALAAYNAGPTRLRRWLASRKDLGPLENVQSSAPEVELWIDELPWDETSFYVKAILRNWLIYRLLSETKVELKDPIWIDEKPLAR